MIQFSRQLFTGARYLSVSSAGPKCDASWGFTRCAGKRLERGEQPARLRIDPPEITPHLRPTRPTAPRW
eukprot:9081766-Pyramimonas_sp.AAC.1